jgi:hypothetical protein
MWPTVQDEPYERKVTRRLAGGLDAAAGAVEQYILGNNPTAFERTVSRGVSSNLCDAAAELSDRGDGVEVSITWARTRPTPSPRWSRTFTRAEGEILRSVSKAFREKQPRPDELLEGFVVKLAREGADADAEGNITLKAYVDDQLVAIRAKLEPADYRSAIEAHEKVHPVRVSGTLERVGQRWKLSNPNLIHVEVDDDN